MLTLTSRPKECVVLTYQDIKIYICAYENKIGIVAPLSVEITRDKREILTIANEQQGR